MEREATFEGTTTAGPPGGQTDQAGAATPTTQGMPTRLREVIAERTTYSGTIYALSEDGRNVAGKPFTVNESHQGLDVGQAKAAGDRIQAACTQRFGKQQTRILGGLRAACTLWFTLDAPAGQPNPDHSVTLSLVLWGGENGQVTAETFALAEQRFEEARAALEALTASQLRTIAEDPTRMAAWAEAAVSNAGDVWSGGGDAPG